MFDNKSRAFFGVILHIEDRWCLICIGINKRAIRWASRIKLLKLLLAVLSWHGVHNVWVMWQLRRRSKIFPIFQNLSKLQGCIHELKLLVIELLFAQKELRLEKWWVCCVLKNFIEITFWIKYFVEFYYIEVHILCFRRAL